MAGAVAGLRLRRSPHIVYYNAEALADLQVNDYVIVDTDKCREVARVVIAPNQVQEVPLNTPLPAILRRANSVDLSQWQQFRLRESEALAQCRAQVTKHNLPMKLLTAEYNV